MAKNFTLIFSILFLSFFPFDAFSSSLQEVVREADLTKDRGEQKHLAKTGLDLAEECLKKNLKSAPCYYYRGIARALYYGHSPFGYVKRVRLMLSDWEMALKLDPTFDNGGPYRMLAEIYRDLPSFFGPKDLRKDLKKALYYAEKSIEISNYPRNHFDKTEILLLSKRREEALHEFEIVKKVLPAWKNHPYYPVWTTTTLQYFEKELEK